MDTIILMLAITSTVLLIVITIKLFLSKKPDCDVANEKIDFLAKLSSDGFNAQRQSDNALRDSIQGSLNSMRDKIEDLSINQKNTQLETVKAISDMREKLDFTGKEQTQSITQGLEKLQQSNEKKLEEMRIIVDEKLQTTLTQRLDSSFKSVSDQLSNVYKSLGEMKELSNSVTTLNRIFTNVKTRGNWAELQLEGILEKIIPGMYVKNYSSDSTRDAVEFAVVIPNGKADKNIYLPIDSKFPMEDYLRLCDAGDNGDAEAVKKIKKALESRVLAEGKNIAKYINPPYTTPFAVMYLATDSLYAEISSSKENIADRLHNDYGVLLAGPSTITALLSSLAMGFRVVALNEKANEVMDLLSAAKLQYDKFGIALEKAKKKIDEASSSIDDAQKRNSIIVKKLKGVEIIEPEKANNILLSDS